MPFECKVDATSRRVICTFAGEVDDDMIFAYLDVVLALRTQNTRGYDHVIDATQVVRVRVTRVAQIVQWVQVRLVPLRSRVVLVTRDRVAQLMMAIIMRGLRVPYLHFDTLEEAIAYINAHPFAFSGARPTTRRAAEGLWGGRRGAAAPRVSPEGGAQPPANRHRR